MHPTDDAGDANAPGVTLAEAFRLWGPRDLIARLDRWGWPLPTVIGRQASHADDEAWTVHRDIQAWLQNCVAEGRLRLSFIDGPGAAAPRIDVPAAWAPDLKLGRYDLSNIYRNGAVMRGVQVRGPGMERSPHEPERGAWVPYEGAEGREGAALAFAPVALRERYEAARESVNGFPARSPDERLKRLLGGLAGAPIVPLPPREAAARSELGQATAQLQKELRRALSDGELEARAVSDPSDGQHDKLFPASAWKYLRFVKGGKVSLKDENGVRTWCDVQIRRPPISINGQDAEAPQIDVPPASDAALDLSLEPSAAALADGEAAQAARTKNALISGHAIDKGGRNRQFEREPFVEEYRRFSENKPSAARRVINAHMQGWAATYYGKPGPSKQWVTGMTRKLRSDAGRAPSRQTTGTDS